MCNVHQDLPVERVVGGLAEALRLEDGVVVGDVEHLVDRLLDEDERDEAGEVLLGEPRDVADEGASVEGDEGQHDDAHPNARPGVKFKAVVSCLLLLFLHLTPSKYSIQMKYNSD